MEKEEKSLFVDFWGDYPIVKVVDFFLTYKLFEYTKSDIAKNVKISRATLDIILEHLEKVGIIKRTKKVGRAVLYTLDENSPISQRLVTLDLALAKVYAGSITRKVPTRIRIPLRA